jgi:hypothetical protein
MDELVCLVYSMKGNRREENELMFSILNEREKGLDRKMD